MSILLDNSLVPVRVNVPIFLKLIKNVHQGKLKRKWSFTCFVTQQLWEKGFPGHPLQDVYMAVNPMFGYLNKPFLMTK